MTRKIIWSRLTVAIGPESLPAFYGRLSSDDPYVRIAAIRGIGAIAADVGTESISTQATTALVRCLEDREAAVRAAAAQSLGELGQQGIKALPALTRHLHDKGSYGVGAIYSEAVAADVLDAILAIGPTDDQIPHLAQLLQAPSALEDGEGEGPLINHGVRLRAIEMLGMLQAKSQPVRSVLTQNLQTRARAVRQLWLWSALTPMIHEQGKLFENVQSLITNLIASGL